MLSCDILATNKVGILQYTTALQVYYQGWSHSLFELMQACPISMPSYAISVIQYLFPILSKITSTSGLHQSWSSSAKWSLCLMSSHWFTSCCTALFQARLLTIVMPVWKNLKHIGYKDWNLCQLSNLDHYRSLLTMSFAQRGRRIFRAGLSASNSLPFDPNLWASIELACSSSEPLPWDECDLIMVWCVKYQQMILCLNL